MMRRKIRLGGRNKWHGRTSEYHYVLYLCAAADDGDESSLSNNNDEEADFEDVLEGGAVVDLKDLAAAAINPAEFSDKEISLDEENDDALDFSKVVAAVTVPLKEVLEELQDNKESDRDVLLLESAVDLMALAAATNPKENGNEDAVDLDELALKDEVENLSLSPEDVQGMMLDDKRIQGVSDSSSFIASPATPTKRKLKFRMKLYQWLMQPKVEVLDAAAVLLSSFLVALSTLNDLPTEAETIISATLLALNIVFALDFFVRWYAAGQFKVIYLTKPLALIDIVVVIIPLLIGILLPLTEYVAQLNVGEVGDLLTSSDTSSLHQDNLSFLLHNPIQDSAGLQNLLLLRVLRLRRVLTDITTFGKFTKALGISRVSSGSIKSYQLQLARVLLSIFTLLSVSTGLIYTAEHTVNPLFADYFTALYFGLTTLTTVGFGDITPVTPAGRLVVCASIIAGVAIIPAQAAKLVEALLELQKDTSPDVRKKRRKSTSSSSSKVVYSGLADGKGPSGVNIEVPGLDEQVKSMKRGLVKGVKVVEGDQIMEAREDNISDWETEQVVSTRTCSQCGEESHRIDASFCWSCGNEL